MSDAKAKAEARRAKILGRNTDRLALAKGNLVINKNTLFQSQDELILVV